MKERKEYVVDRLNIRSINLDWENGPKSLVKIWDDKAQITSFDKACMDLTRVKDIDGLTNHVSVRNDYLNKDIKLPLRECQDCSADNKYSVISVQSGAKFG